MDTNKLLLIGIVIIIVCWWFSNSREKYSGFSSFYGTPRGNCSNDLHEDVAVYGATPWSVVPPSWIGRLDQGNGLIGDGPNSGFTFSPAM